MVKASLTAKLKSGLSVTLAQKTEYPIEGLNVIRVTPSKAGEFTLKLRIPHWSTRTSVKLNGKAIPGIEPGRYAEIKRKWRRGDRIDLDPEAFPRMQDVLIDDSSISNHHVIFYNDDGELALVDMGSKNGTLVNGQPVVATHLTHGDLITIGQSKLRVE